MNYVDRILQTTEEYIKPQGVKILSLIGLAFAASASFRLLRSFSSTFLTIGHNLPQRYGKGSWAVITGASRGIGAAFGDRLAALGFNIILISRKQTALDATAASIKAKYPTVEIRTIACDFSKSWEEGFYDNLLRNFQGLDISILVNNVGTGSGLGPFYMVPEETLLRTITVNTVPITVLSRRIIPSMLKRTDRSAIINVSSMSAVTPMNSLGHYSATKAYFDVLSRMVEEDVRHKIDVMALRPDAVSTEMIGSVEVGSYIISPESTADAGLRKLGNTNATYGHWRHEIKGWLSKNKVIRDTLFDSLVKSIKKKSASDEQNART